MSQKSTLRKNQNPFATTSVLEFYSKTKHKLDSFGMTVGKALSKDFLGILLLPPKTNEGKKRYKKGELRKAYKILVITKNIQSGNIKKKIDEREQIVEKAKEDNKLANIEFEILHIAGLWRLFEDADVAEIRRIATSEIIIDNGFLSTIILSIHLKGKILSRFLRC